MGKLHEILERPIKSKDACRWKTLDTVYFGYGKNQLDYRVKVQLCYHEWDGKMAFKVNNKLKKSTIVNSSSIVHLNYRGHQLMGCGQYWTGDFPVEKIIKFGAINT